ncbi:MAG TPA: translation initiation factor IF-2 N-terminal domain-containing protein [Pyrinomonadaceae bacterium]|nr:translation initiation factor IF-2 N-terminal domain-containing protein [Pyrinomonadaceae bacterium]
MVDSAKDEEPQIGIRSDYLTYKRQKCFVAYTESAPWSPDLLKACAETLEAFDLEIDYGTKHYDAEVPMHEKARQLIANARCGIYDLSYWPDEKNNWQLPRNVFIELGMAIALNRPALMVRHASNRHLELPDCLKSVSGHIVEWSGDATLEERLSKLLPEWLETSPKEDWLDLFCKFGHRVCDYRKADPRSRQWGRKELPGHVSDGPDLDRPDFRKAVAKVLERYNDLQITYLDTLGIQKDYQFLLCSHCQTVRSTSFAIDRLTNDSPPETFIGIGITLALEKQFGYSIPKLLLGASKNDLPSLLAGYEIAPAANSTQIKDSLSRFMPEVIQKVRRVVWEPRPLPFIEIKRFKAAEMATESGEDLIEAADEHAKPRRVWEEFLVKIAREVESVMQREMFTPPGGPTYIPREYIVYLSNDDDKEWQGDKRRRLEQGLFHVLSERAHELSGQTQLAAKSFAVELRVDGTLEKGEFRVQAVWDETNAGATMVTPQVEIQRLLERAENAERDRQYDAAVYAYKEALELAPREASIHTKLGEFYARWSQLEDAALCYDQVQKLEPDNAENALKLANILMSLRKYEGAISAFDFALGRNPHDLASWFSLIEALTKTNRFEQAEDNYRKAILLFPEEMALRTALGSALLKRGEYQKAERVYLEAIGQFPQYVEPRNGLAAVLVTSGRRRMARDVYEETLGLFPADAKAKAGVTQLTSWLNTRSKVRVYDLAKELKLDTKRLIEEIRLEGVDLSVPSNSISRELAEKFREKYFPKKGKPTKRAIKFIRRSELQPPPWEDEDFSLSEDPNDEETERAIAISSLSEWADPAAPVASSQTDLATNSAASSPAVPDPETETIDLMARVANGDEAAFSLIFERFSKQVLHLILSLVKDQRLAEDLTQETFVMAYRNVDSLMNEKQIGAFLMLVARSVARRHLNRLPRTEIVAPVEIPQVDNSMRQFLDKKSSPKDFAKKVKPKKS